MMLRRWIAICGRKGFSIRYHHRIPGVLAEKVDLSTKENAELAAAAPELLAECVAALESLKLARIGNVVPSVEQIDRLEKLIEQARPKSSSGF